MLFRRTPILALLALASLSLVSACATSGSPSLIFPPNADVKVQPKPQLSPDAVDSEAALIAHDIALETWGEEGWAAVGRICRWGVANGAPYPRGWCPAAPEPEREDDP